MISQTNYSPPYGGAFHTALPIAKEIQGQKWMVVFQESIAPYNKEGRKMMWVIDITFEENPVSVSTYDVPVKGFDLEKRTREIDSEKRMGLRSLQERTNLLGGSMIVKSQLGQGTKILIKLPQTG